MKTIIKNKSIRVQQILCILLIIIYLLIDFLSEWKINWFIFFSLLIYTYFISFLLLLFSYYWGKRIRLAGINSQKYLKDQIGLYKHEITFAEYFKFIYAKRFKRKEQAKAIKNVKEHYIAATVIKEIMVILLFASLYILFVYKNFNSIIYACIFLLACIPLLIFILDLYILRTRYEEGIFTEITCENNSNQE